MDDAGWVRRVVQGDADARTQAVLVASFLGMRDKRLVDAASQPPPDAAPLAPVSLSHAEPEPVSASEPEVEESSFPLRSRVFFGLAAAVGFSSVRAGMRADGSPTGDLPVYDASGRFAVSPWVPDADSHDAQGAARGECPGDGARSHPSGMIDGERVPTNPTRYCARVTQPGVSMAPALRAHLGYWLSPLWAVQAIARWQFASGQGPLASTPRLHEFGSQCSRATTLPRWGRGGHLGEGLWRADSPDKRLPTLSSCQMTISATYAERPVGPIGGSEAPRALRSTLSHRGWNLVNMGFACRRRGACRGDDCLPQAPAV